LSEKQGAERDDAVNNTRTEKKNKERRKKKEREGDLI
jgi:hypothetical protein